MSNTSTSEDTPIEQTGTEKNNQKKITRRDFLAKAALLAGGLVIEAFGQKDKPHQSKEPQKPTPSIETTTDNITRAFDAKPTLDKSPTLDENDIVVQITGLSSEQEKTLRELIIWVTRRYKEVLGVDRLPKWNAEIICADGENPSSAFTHGVGQSDFSSGGKIRLDPNHLDGIAFETHTLAGFRWRAVIQESVGKIIRDLIVTDTADLKNIQKLDVNEKLNKMTDIGTFYSPNPKLGYYDLTASGANAIQTLLLDYRSNTGRSNFLGLLCQKGWEFVSSHDADQYRDSVGVATIPTDKFLEFVNELLPGYDQKVRDNYKVLLI